MNPQVKQLWVIALRSGKYQRGEGGFRIRGRYCPLGVLCDLHSKATQTNWDSGDTYLGRQSWLPREVMRWASLDEATPVLKVPHQTLSSATHIIPWLNDKLHMSFDQLASLIEEQL